MRQDPAIQAAGTRPGPGRNHAITEDGRADYVLLLGLRAVTVVEAERQSKFATNGRPSLEPLKTQSGIYPQYPSERPMQPSLLQSKRRPGLLLTSAWLLLAGACASVKLDSRKATTFVEQPVDVAARRELLQARWLPGEPDTRANRPLLQQGWHEVTGESAKLVFWFLPEALPPSKETPATQPSEFAFRVATLSNDSSCETRARVQPFGAHAPLRLELQPIEPGCPRLQPGVEYKVTPLFAGFEKEALPVQLPPAPAARLSKAFSFLPFSCMEPFDIKAKGLPNRRLNAFHLFKDRSTGALNLPRELPARPLFALGLGDQMYVDAGSEGVGNTAEFSTRGIPLFFGNQSNLINFNAHETRENLELLYRYHFAIPPFDKALRHMPALMMWDDHEIRDGWGSHGDEHTGFWPAYFKEAREAFIAYEASRNPRWPAGDQREQPVDIRLDLGSDVRTLVLDTRSCRSTPVNFAPPQAHARSQVLCDESWGHLEEWLRVEPNAPPTLFVLGVATVLSVAPTQVMDLYATADKEVLDDIGDAWGAEKATEDRKKLLEMLEQHFTSRPHDRLLVLSGDVHESGLYYLYLKDVAACANKEQAGECKPRLYGHEVVSSGLAADKLGKRSYMSHNGFQSASLTPRTMSYGGGSVRASNFAEVVVSPGDDKTAPKVQVLFYPSSTYVYNRFWWDERRLANVSSSMASYFEKPLTTLADATKLLSAAKDQEASSVGAVAIDLSKEMDATRFTGGNALHANSVLCWVKPDESNPATLHDAAATSWEPLPGNIPCSPAPR